MWRMDASMKSDPDSQLCTLAMQLNVQTAVQLSVQLAVQVAVQLAVLLTAQPARSRPAGFSYHFLQRRDFYGSLSAVAG